MKMLLPVLLMLATGKTILPGEVKATSSRSSAGVW